MKFNDKELKGIVAGDCDVLNNLNVFIPARYIKAEDGADKQIEELVKNNPGNDSVKYIAGLFYEYNPKQ